MTDAAFQARLRRFYALWRENNDIYAEWAQARGLSYFELLVILSLAEGEKTQRQICDQWTLPKQTVHSILRAFQRQGWVTLEPMEADRRNKAVRLTPAGRVAVSILVSISCAFAGLRRSEKAYAGMKNPRAASAAARGFC